MGSVSVRQLTETRRNRLLIRNVKQSLEVYSQQKPLSEVAKIMTKPNKENDNEASPSTEIFDWLQQQKEFDMRYNTSKFGVLESKVSKFAEKFDPISSLDDEFYEYTGPS